MADGELVEPEHVHHAETKKIFKELYLGNCDILAEQNISSIKEMKWTKIWLK